MILLSFLYLILVLMALVGGTALVCAVGDSTAIVTGFFLPVQLLATFGRTQQRYPDRRGPPGQVVTCARPPLRPSRYVTSVLHGFCVPASDRVRGGLAVVVVVP